MSLATGIVALNKMECSHADMKLLGNVLREPVRYVMDFPSFCCELRDFPESSREESRGLYRCHDQKPRHLGLDMLIFKSRSPR